jgi:hypothetical protein
MEIMFLANPLLTKFFNIEKFWGLRSLGLANWAFVLGDFPLRYWVRMRGHLLIENLPCISVLETFLLWVGDRLFGLGRTTHAFGLID